MEKQFHQKKLTNPELAEFFNQMHMLLASGISSTEAISLLSEDGTETEKALLNHMFEQIEYSGSLYDAVQAADVFPDYALHMIRLGEDTGTLDEIMKGLSEHYTREENILNMIRSSFVYPSIMLGMMFLIILVLLTKVMPIFNQVFEQLGQELSGFSAALLITGETLSKYSIGFTIIILVVILLVFLNRKRLPFQKNIQEKTSACRFADGMSIALKSGLTSESALELSADLIESDDFKQRILNCKEQIDQGVLLSEALLQNNIFKGSYARIARIAEKAGTLDEAMAHIASEYEYDINNTISRRIAMIEPSLVIILSLIVGIILFSVMLPLLGIMSNL